MERTLAILKPDCVKLGLLGTCLQRIEAEGFTIRALRMRTMTRREAEAFYAVHQGKGFFAGLIEFMTEGPCVTLILERDDAVAQWRRVLEELRQAHGENLTRNIAHGSDAAETSAFECGFLFAGADLV